MASDLKELDSCDCRHMAATTQIKMFKPNKRGSMTVKVMSYRVLRQYTLRFGYVRIKQEKRERYQYKRRNKKVPLHSAKQLFYVSNGTNYINYANFILMVITALCCLPFLL